jgi:hypothetical protein
MGYYTMSFSMAHIASSKTGMQIIAHKGYNMNWLTMGSLGIIAVILTFIVLSITRRESNSPR